MGKKTHEETVALEDIRWEMGLNYMLECLRMQISLRTSIICTPEKALLMCVNFKKQYKRAHPTSNPRSLGRYLSGNQSRYVLERMDLRRHWSSVAIIIPQNVGRQRRRTESSKANAVEIKTWLAIKAEEVMVHIKYEEASILIRILVNLRYLTNFIKVFLTCSKHYLGNYRLLARVPNSKLVACVAVHLSCCETASAETQCSIY